MKPSPALVVLSCLVLLAACQLQQPIGPSPTVRPILLAPAVTLTSLPPTLTSEELSTYARRWTPMPAITPTPFVEIVPLESPSILNTAVASAWAYWPAQLQGWLTVAANDETVWAGTPDGVYRIDPRTGSYTAYPEVGPIEMLLPLEDGRLWAKGNNSVFFFDGHHWSKLGLVAIANTLGIDLAGDLWLVDLNGRFGPMAVRFTGHTPPDDSTWPYDYYPPYDMPPQFSVKLTNCQAWAAIVSQPYGSISRLYSHRTPQECQALQATYPLTPRSDSSPTLVAIDRDGSIWSVIDRVVHHRVGDTTTEQTLPTDQIMTIAPDPAHGLWLGTDRGVWYSDGKTLHAIPLDSDPHATLRPHPHNLTIDTHGNAWVITAQGIQLLSAHGSKWQTVTDVALSPGINEWPVGAIAAAHEGGIWATHGGDLWRFGGSTMTPLTGTIPLGPYCRLNHLTVDRAGNVWSPLGACGAAVFRPSIHQWVLYASNYYHNNLDLSGAVADIFIGGDGAVYAGSRHSPLYRFVSFTDSNGPISQTWQLVRAMPHEEFLALGADAQHGQWTINCLTGEVWREQVETSSAPDSGSTESVAAFGKVFAASTSSRFCALSYRWYFDSRSWLWVYDGVNLFRYDGQTWQPAYQPRVGTVQDLTSGPDGRVWIVGDRGVAVYDPTKDKQP